LIIIVVIVILAIFVAAGFIILPRINNQKNNKVWQAVFLSNGQVYFGHLQNRNSQYPVLTEIYYLKVQQALQPEGNTNTNTNTNQTQLSLIKLGDELHGPQDKMIINKDQILFIEDLKDDSQVVKTILQNKK
jgi:hypothetical protein